MHELGEKKNPEPLAQRYKGNMAVDSPHDAMSNGNVSREKSSYACDKTRIKELCKMLERERSFLPRKEDASWSTFSVNPHNRF
jgi:hypothetical protein